MPKKEGNNKKSNGADSPVTANVKIRLLMASKVYHIFQN